jgi:hypothetical protein
MALGEYMTRNWRRYISYTVLAILFVGLLAGCALWPSLFDTNEHARIVNIHVASLDNSVCAKRETAAPVAQQMYQDSLWVWHYGQTLRNNQAMISMELNLMQITKELNDRYAKGDVSVFYCKNKFENIQRATDTIIKVSARRPRS